MYIIIFIKYGNITMATRSNFSFGNPLDICQNLATATRAISLQLYPSNLWVTGSEEARQGTL